ncbi:hypothetical protein KYK29_20710 [Shinella daejeonensis]|uniref:hypothetical protein n=1 Tax=Shinella daejeonensis TaxID=659017 RepID=UPI0020C81518|nr:hypothetical protein [Shinella daejeonensis]MCP8897356.1 hypothetical protein [Shinella daejeonensis]
MSAYGAKRRQSTGRIDLLPPEPRAGARKPPVRRAREDTIDAAFVTIRPDGRATSNDNRPSRRPPHRGRGILSGMTDLAAAAGRLAEGMLARLPASAFAGLVGAAFLVVFASAGGLSALSAALPAGDIAPLRISGVSARIEDSNGMKVLAVHGRLDNASGVVQAVPPLDIRIGEGRDVLDRRVVLAAATLSAGEGDHFLLRMPHAGGKLPKVSVSVVGQDAQVR